MNVDIVDKYCTDDNNPIKNLRLKNPDPHQSDKLSPELDPNLFVDDMLKCVKFDHISSLFQGP